MDEMTQVGQSAHSTSETLMTSLLLMIRRVNSLHALSRVEVTFPFYKGTSSDHDDKKKAANEKLRKASEKLRKAGKSNSSHALG